MLPAWPALRAPVFHARTFHSAACHRARVSETIGVRCRSSTCSYNPLFRLASPACRPPSFEKVRADGTPYYPRGRPVRRGIFSGGGDLGASPGLQLVPGERKAKGKRACEKKEGAGGGGGTYVRVCAVRFSRSEWVLARAAHSVLFVFRARGSVAKTKARRERAKRGGRETRSRVGDRQQRRENGFCVWVWRCAHNSGRGCMGVLVDWHPK